MPTRDDPARELALARYGRLSELAMAAHGALSALQAEFEECRTAAGRAEAHFATAGMGLDGRLVADAAGLAFVVKPTARSVAPSPATPGLRATIEHDERRTRAPEHDAEAKRIQRHRQRQATAMEQRDAAGARWRALAAARQSAGTLLDEKGWIPADDVDGRQAIVVGRSA